MTSPNVWFTFDVICQTLVSSLRKTSYLQSSSSLNHCCKNAKLNYLSLCKLQGFCSFYVGVLCEKVDTFCLTSLERAWLWWRHKNDKFRGVAKRDSDSVYEAQPHCNAAPTVFNLQPSILGKNLRKMNFLTNLETSSFAANLSQQFSISFQIFVCS